jgi:hypothetical protein
MGFRQIGRLTPVIKTFNNLLAEEVLLERIAMAISGNDNNAKIV